MKIRDDHGDGSSAVASALDAEAEAGMAAMSDEFGAKGNRMYLPLAE